MRRTIEKLGQDRREKEERFRQDLDRLKTLSGELDQLLDRVKSSDRAPRAGGLFRSRETAPQVRDFLSRAVESTKSLTGTLAELLETQDALGDARDREWDALGSNHVGMIFKSMEWRVDRLAEAYEDVQVLMKKFVLLQDQLGRLLAALEKNELPSPARVRELLEPLEDWSYTRFENRFRGFGRDVQKQQEAYVAFFPKGGKVLDLGCGRGEFLDLLRTHGLEGYGVDVNGSMVDICFDKGLRAEKGDILEALAGRPDASLDGIFSSQVIEHLSPPYLRRMIELSFAKLAPGGVIILETINPASVFALVQIYFLDMTHRQPVHPQALRFLLETSGFVHVEIRCAGELADERLQNLPGADEVSAVMNRNIDRLNDLLYAPPNYAAIARKK